MGLLEMAAPHQIYEKIRLLFSNSAYISSKGSGGACVYNWYTSYNSLLRLRLIRKFVSLYLDFQLRMNSLRMRFPSSI